MKDFKYKDIDSVQDLFTNYSEKRVANMLKYRESLEIGRLALNKTYRTETEAIGAVIAYFKNPDVISPEPECGCQMPEGRRWHEMPVTWAYSPYKEDIPNTIVMIREIMSELQKMCQIELIENNDRRANIFISNRRLDGYGGTLGITYVPASGNRMSSCGPQCGDIIIDKDEIWTREFLYTVLRHEIGHALGLTHRQERQSLMYPSYLGPRGWHTLDINDLLQKYPWST